MAKRVGCPVGKTLYYGKCRSPRYVLDETGAKRWTSHGEHIEMWSPDMFLRYASLPEGLTSKISLEKIRRRILMQKGLDPCYIDLSREHLKNLPAGWVPNHEGRHRAVVAREFGIEKIPVAVLRE